MAQAALYAPVDPAVFVKLTTNLYHLPATTLTLLMVVSVFAPEVRYCSRNDQIPAAVGITRKVSKVTPAFALSPLLFTFMKPNWTLLPLVCPFSFTSTDTMGVAPIVEKSQEPPLYA